MQGAWLAVIFVRRKARTWLGGAQAIAMEYGLVQRLAMLKSPRFF